MQQVKEYSISIGQSETLKWIAIVTMIIDHIGAIFFPQELVYRLIGRIAFPIFAYQISVGAIYSKRKIVYSFRLLVFALISQLPYQWAFGYDLSTLKLNIFFTLFLGLILIFVLISKNLWVWLAIPVVIFLGFTLPLDYGVYGLLLPSLFYLLKKWKTWSVIAFTMWTLLSIDWFSMNVIQAYSIFGMLIITAITAQTLNLPRTNKWIFYAFYPLHLTILAVVDRVL